MMKRNASPKKNEKSGGNASRRLSAYECPLVSARRPLSADECNIDDRAAGEAVDRRRWAAPINTSTYTCALFFDTRWKRHMVQISIWNPDYRLARLVDYQSEWVINCCRLKSFTGIFRLNGLAELA